MMWAVRHLICDRPHDVDPIPSHPEAFLFQINRGRDTNPHGGFVSNHTVRTVTLFGYCIVEGVSLAYRRYGHTNAQLHLSNR